MFNNNKKIEYYDVLNSIRMEYLKSKEPFNIIESNVKLTYNDIQLRYLNDKNYFIVVKKSSYKDRYDNKKNNRNQRNDDNASKSPRTGRDRTTRSDNQRSQYNKKPNFTPEETAVYLERKKRRDHSKSPQRDHSKSPQRDKKNRN